MTAAAVPCDEVTNRDFANEVETGNIKFQAATLTIYSIGLL